VDFETIIFEKLDHVAVITLNRPEVLNAVNSQLCADVGEALEVIANDPKIRVSVITGSGSRAFCVGADLKAVAAGEFGSKEQAGRWGFAGVTDHYINKPIIAAVNGIAFGGGTEIALAADIVVASEQASFALTEVTLGLIAGAGGILRLSRQIPQKIAARMVFEGSPLTAADAARWGLINEVVDADDVMPCAMRIAEKIAANSPSSVRASKEVFYRGLDSPLNFPPTARELNQKYVDEIMRGADAAEGPLAFSEKRPPVWKDDE
jgi:crotonobetainyl-CoA hydratase